MAIDEKSAVRKLYGDSIITKPPVQKKASPQQPVKTVKKFVAPKATQTQSGKK